MMDRYAQQLKWSKTLSNDANVEANGRNWYLHRDDSLALSSLEQDVAMENLPKGVYTTTDGHEYFFNHDHAILFAHDPVRGVPLPVTRYMFVPNIVESKTVYYYEGFPVDIMPYTATKPVHLSEKQVWVESLSQIYLDFYTKYPKDGRIGCCEWFNGFTRTRSASKLLSIIATDNVPYGCFVTSEGHEYYFSREYFVIFGWNPKEQKLIPTHHQMVIDSVRTDYVYKSKLEQSFRRSVTLMDDIYRRAMLNTGH